MGAFWVDAPCDEALRAAGVADSKRLSPRRRAEARARLDALGRTALRRISPAAIDAGNLNTLEEAAILELVARFRPAQVIVDALGHPSTLPATLARLAAASGEPSIEWRMEPRADHHHPVVGAASIVAKTARDEALDALVATHGPLGSGYPSDPTTRAWLIAHAATDAPWPPFVRTRWETVRRLRAAPPLLTPSARH